MKTRQSQENKSNKLNARKSPAGLSCLVAGYDPFGGDRINPSGAVAQLMPRYLLVKGSRVDVSTLVLPVQAEKAWLLLKDTIAKLPAKDKKVIIMLGLYADKITMQIERFALNIRDYRIKDNDGNQFTGEKIYKKAPEAIRTRAPIEEAVNRVRKMGLPIVISNYAGTFVCNDGYFRALYHLQNSKQTDLVSFIHLPLPRVYGMALRKMGGKHKHLAGNKKNQHIAMSKAIKIIAQVYCEYLAQKK